MGSTQISARVDAAVGMEYISADQQTISLSFWGAKYLDKQLESQHEEAQVPVMIAQWNKSVLHQTLDLSAILIVLDQDNSYLTTGGLKYRWTDQLITNLNLSFGHSKAEVNPLGVSHSVGLSAEMIF